jgi:hypothetical protein
VIGLFFTVGLFCQVGKKKLDNVEGEIEKSIDDIKPKVSGQN